METDGRHRQLSIGSWRITAVIEIAGAELQVLDQVRRPVGDGCRDLQRASLSNLRLYERRVAVGSSSPALTSSTS